MDTDASLKPEDSSVGAIARLHPLDRGLLHRSLVALNRRRRSPALPSPTWVREARADLELTLLEGHFVETERAAIAAETARLPDDVEGFSAWFRGLEARGPGQHDPLFPWLAERASLAAMQWFLRQEIAGEAGFDDLVALTQVKVPVQAKLDNLMTGIRLHPTLRLPIDRSSRANGDADRGCALPGARAVTRVIAFFVRTGL